MSSTLSSPPLPCVIAVGGFDPGGGAGLVRDFVTARALGARPVLVGTAWTLQGPDEPVAVEPRPSAAVAHALRQALDRAPAGQTAVKVGMVANLDQVEALLEVLTAFSGPVVVDPVLQATQGGALFDGSPQALIPLGRRATLLTPNLAEAAALTGLPVTTAEEVVVAGQHLVAAGVPAVLIKGGHLPGAAVDFFFEQGRDQRLAAPRLAGLSPRGTGCALATAIAVHLAQGLSLPAAIAAAKAWTFDRIGEAQWVDSQRFL